MIPFYIYLMEFAMLIGETSIYDFLDDTEEILEYSYSYWPYMIQEDNYIA